MGSSAIAWLLEEALQEPVISREHWSSQIRQGKEQFFPIERNFKEDYAAPSSTKEYSKPSAVEHTYANSQEAWVGLQPVKWLLRRASVFLRLWLLVGQPSSSGWPHAQMQMESRNWSHYVFEEARRHEVVRWREERKGAGGVKGENWGWIWSKYKQFSNN